MQIKTLGKRLEICRQERHMGKPELAEKLHVDPSLVEKWEADVICPQLDMLHRIAEALHIPIEALLGKKSLDEALGMTQAQRIAILKSAGREVKRDNRGLLLILILVDLFLTICLSRALQRLEPYSISQVFGWCSLITASIHLVFNKRNLERCILLLLVLVEALCRTVLRRGIPMWHWLVVAALVLLTYFIHIVTRRKQYIHGCMATHHMKACRTSGIFSYLGYISNTWLIVAEPVFTCGDCSVKLGALHVDLTGCSCFDKDARLELSTNAAAVSVAVPDWAKIETEPASPIPIHKVKGSASPLPSAKLTLAGQSRCSRLTVIYVPAAESSLAPET